MAAGFQTENGSLYWVDALLRVHRLKLSPGEDHGKIFEPRSCVYISSKLHDEVLKSEPVSINRIYLACLKNGMLTECRTPGQLSEAFARGDNGGIAMMDRGSQTLVGGGAGKQHPEIGLYPFDQVFAADPLQQGEVRRHYHLGSKIIKLYESEADLIAVGFPRLHIDKHKAAIARMRQPSGPSGPA